ncbi:MAG TPA: M48 family metalloprotease [Amaricoccus sp.]|jgi:Zn-dependent protease with chaperone function|nr:M48 family metalloprotease [Amaricoccus sp.]
MRLPLALCLALAACGTTYAVPGGPDATAPQAGAAPASPPGRARTTGDYARVLARVEPAAERLCRQEQPDAPAAWCDYRITLDRDPDAAPNAYQSEGDDGRPDVHFAATLLPLMTSDDEIAFVLSHEAGHHIAGHVPKQRQQQALGALVGGLAAAVGNAYGIPMAQDEAMNVGASVGGRAYSQTYELEADTLGAFIAARAGYDPERGADFFGRPEIASAGGLPILVSHPGSAQREATVARAAAEIRRQRAQGLEPTPDAAR